MPQVDQRVYYTLGRDTGLAIMDNKLMNELLVYAKPFVHMFFQKEGFQAFIH